MRRIGLILSLIVLAGCTKQPSGEVVVYTALDSEYSAPIQKKFTEETKIAVVPKFDTEEEKTVRLVEAIINDADQPKCDVFWNNEILFTMRLKRRGLLEPYRPAIASSFPHEYRDAEGYWYGFAARARVLIVNTNLVAEKDRPHSILAFADPKWKGRAAMPEPLFGTSATQAACLFSVWGDAKAKRYYQNVKDNHVHFMAGDRPVAEAVGNGELAFGLTDTDDAVIQLESKKPVAIIYPDQEDGGLGTLFIPNTVSIVRGCPHPTAARRFVDYVLSPATEAALAACPSAQIPLNPDVKLPARVETPQTIRAMKVDFELATEKWDEAAVFLRRLLAE
jgi:iron(III) transport system substrate-binding protein